MTPPIFTTSPAPPPTEFTGRGKAECRRLTIPGFGKLWRRVECRRLARLACPTVHVRHRVVISSVAPEGAR